MDKEQFINNLKNIGIDLSEDQVKLFDVYCSFLKEYNSHTNLTAIVDDDQIFLKHFYDSLMIVKVIDLNNCSSLIDIGTGAGFPGMVLKIVYPHLKVVLLDSNNKKITFLKELSKKLGIDDIDFSSKRAEEYVKMNREKFDVVTARAVTNLSALSELCIPLVRVGGYFVPLKGSNKEEINDALYAIEELGGLTKKILNFELPYYAGERNIILVEKRNVTPLKYPRRFEKIKNNPLKKSGK